MQGHEIERREGGELAWSHPTPIDGVQGIAGRICSYSERADHVVGGEPVERAVSPWSPTIRDAAGRSRR